MGLLISLSCHKFNDYYLLMITFTTLGFRKKYFFNFLLRSLRRGHVKKKQNSFQRYIHDAKKFINCYYCHYSAIMTKKYIFSFQHYYIHYTVMLKKNNFFPIANCYFVHDVVIMSKNIFPIATFTTP